MRLAVVGHKEMGPSDLDTIALHLIRFLRDEDVHEVLFSGTEGVGTNALALALSWRRQTGRPTPRFVMVMPDMILTRPPWTPTPPHPWEWAPSADQVIELAKPLQARDAFKSFATCGQYLVEQVAQEGQLLAFWNGSRRSMTGQTVSYAQKLDVPWEHVPITGG